MRTPIPSNGRPRRRLIQLLAPARAVPPLSTGVVRVNNPRGLHARAGMLLARLLARFDADVVLSTRGIEADGRKPESVLSLGASVGDAIAVSCRGPHAAAALAAIEDYFASDFLVREEGE